MKPSILRKIFSLPYLPVVIAPWILMAPVIFTGQAVYWGTPYLQFLPWRAWSLQTLLNGDLPLWSSSIGMGAPLVANYQSALFYPPNWLLWLLQLIGGIGAHAWGQGVLMALHLMWAGIGMIWLGRDLGFSRLAQAISGLAFSLSGYLVARAGFLSINAAVAWLPWIILSVQRVIDGYQTSIEKLSFRQTTRLWLPFALCAAMQLLAGHAQTTWYTLLLAALWLVWALIKKTHRALIKPLIIGFAAALIVAVALAAIQLFPTAEYLLQSQRSTAVDYDYAMNYSLDPWSLITFIAPWIFGNPAHSDYWLKIYYWETAIYIGLFPFLLAISAGIRGLFRRLRKENDLPEDPNAQQRSRLLPFLFAVTIVSLLFALGKNTPIFPFLYQYIPTFDMFQAPARFSICAVFALSLLAGIGIEGWHQPEGRGLYWTRLLTAGAFAITIGSGLTWYFMQGVRMTFITGAAVAGLWALGIGVLTLIAPKKEEPDSRPWWRWAVAVWICVDLLVSEWGLNPGISTDVYEKTVTNQASISSSTAGHRVFLPADDEDQLKYERFFPADTFTSQAESTSLAEVNLPETNLLSGISMVNNYDPLLPARYVRWMDYVNSLTSSERLPWLRLMDVSIIETVDPSSDSGVSYETASDPVRFSWSNCAEYTTNEESSWSAVQTKLDNPQSDLLGGWSVIENVNPDDQVGCNSGHVTALSVMEQDNDKVVIQVEADQEGWLIQSDVWFPGWQAYVDGKPVKLYRADYLFRGVSVPAGSHTIEIVYRPSVFYLGAAVSILALLALLAYFRLKWWYKKYG